MKVLMHICCANCALYPISELRERGVMVQGLWFNPNIHPFTEYKSRLDALKQLEALWDLDLLYNDVYGLKEYLRNVAGREEQRCEYCYAVRLEETAKKAKELGVDAFSTSLLVSPYQKFDKIIEIGKLMQEKHDVEFLDQDFRGGFKTGQALSKELGLYRQKYCGCIYSEAERYKR